MRLKPRKSLVRYRLMEWPNGRRFREAAGKWEVDQAFHARVMLRIWDTVSVRLLQQLHDGGVSFKQEGNHP